jgi:hypothetical protein
MAKRRLPEKAQRMLQFLLALKKKAIARTLKKHGFSQENLDTGWALFQAAVGNTLDDSGDPPPDPNDLALLDDWENRWYPIIEATLEAHFPTIRAKVFLNLTQTQGRQLIPNITKLLARLAALTSEKATEQEKKAAALLVVRGLTPDRIEHAQTLLQRLSTIEDFDDEGGSDEAITEVEQAAETAAEAAMWSFYKEWSTISRAAIKSRGLLRTLGFLETPEDKTNGGPEEEPFPQPPLPTA